MNRTTIDFGIDLGTTNSAIAVLNNIDAIIIKNDRDQDVTPSAVGISKTGELRRGEGAKNMFVAMKDAHIEFKRQMGTETVYEFKESGVRKKPEELSAEILKSLRADVLRVLGEDVTTAVITVPAAFELHQCDATRKAAELAGLRSSPLLQEPVAAALAYGFQVDTEKAYWLVYDFGGGTFDAAVIKAEEGLVNVVHHGGNNFLGGSDIDWSIVERVIIPRLVSNYNLPEFKRGNARWAKELRLLKHFVEIAKIELTNKSSASLLGCSFPDASGQSVDGEEIALTRDEVVAMAEPIVRRSTEICLKVLKDKNLPAAAIQKVILVGGPTKAPYFREILREQLQIAIDFTRDPLTVVAKGAAVFAATQKIDPRLLSRAKVGEYQIDLLKSNKSVGYETDPLIGGKVVDPAGGRVEGFTIELVNAKTKWRSGKLTLKSDGAFLINLLAEKGERNTFTIELHDASGTQQKPIPDQLVYTVGAVVEEQPVINSMGVALAGNEVEWFFLKGSGLPQKKKSQHAFLTSHAVKVGEDGDAVRIPIVEGESNAADRNRLIGELKIPSNKIKRDLPAGSEVEITLKMDESRILTVYAYITTLDEEFELTLDLRKPDVVPADLQLDFEREMERMQTLAKKAGNMTEAAAQQIIQDIRGSSLMQELQESISASTGEPAAAQKAEKQLLEFRLRLDDVESVIHWPTMVAEINDWLEELDKLVKQYGTEQQQHRAAELSREAAEIIAAHEVERLTRKQKQISDLYFKVLYSIPGYWVSQFQTLEAERASLKDPEQAERLLEMGRNYMDQNNVDGLRNVVVRLWELSPPQITKEAQRGLGSGLLLRSFK
jgi:molecular chaperone DnaK